jgi:hypothetical protein
LITGGNAHLRQVLWGIYLKFSLNSCWAYSLNMGGYRPNFCIRLKRDLREIPRREAAFDLFH